MHLTTRSDRLRILAVHNRYLQPGGEDNSHAAEVALLRAHGHDVDEYTQDNQRVAQLGRARVAARTIWSRQTYREVRALLRDGRHDAVHIQNFFPLISPSIYYAARAQNVPAIQTLRNYRLFCTNGLMFRDNQPCEDCLGRPIAWPGIRHRCYRGSAAGTATVAAMQSTHRALGTWRRAVTRYVVLTEFAKQKFIQAGLPPHKLFVKPNFVDPDPCPGRGDGNTLVFVGRLSEEKGIETLLNAWKTLAPQAAVTLKIIGDGPMADRVKQFTTTHPSTQWLGAQLRQEVDHALGNAIALIFPSLWYEGMPRTIIEAYAKGTPVIAPRLGAMESMIRHNHTGYHFTPGDPADLAATIQHALQNPQTLQAMRENARREYEDNYTAQTNYTLLHRLIQDAVRSMKTPATEHGSGTKNV